MKVSFVIPTIHQYEMLFDDCIASLKKHHEKEIQDGSAEIIVVDDGSPIALQKRISQECVNQNVKFLIHQHNLGFPKSVNLGMKNASGDLIVLVNNDIQFTQNVIQPLNQAFRKDPKIGIVGGLLFYPNGTIQHGGIIHAGPGVFTHRGWHQSLAQAPEVQVQDYLIAVTGALFAIKKEMIQEIGDLNENYFLACEDTEYCLRAWLKGWKVFYTDQMKAIHAEGGTRGNNNLDKQKKNRNWFLKELQTLKKFQEDLKEINLNEIQQKVLQANLKDQSFKQNHSYEIKNYKKEIKISQSTPSLDRSHKKVMFKRMGALGDVILTTGIVREYKKKYPNYEITFVTRSPEVYINHPDVNFLALSPPLKKFDHIIDLDLAYEREPKISMIQAYAKKTFDSIEPEKPLETFAPELYSTKKDWDSLIQKLKHLHIHLGIEKVILIHMGVGWKSRTLNRDKWNVITKSLSAKGYKILVVGRGSDYRSDLYTNVFNLNDQLTIHEIRELMNHSHLFVGMDSGLLHVAMTTEIPLIGVFSVANPDLRLIPRKSETLAILPKLECRFCLHEQTPPVTSLECQYGTNHCVEDLNPEVILNVIQKVMIE